MTLSKGARERLGRALADKKPKAKAKATQAVETVTVPELEGLLAECSKGTLVVLGEITTEKEVVHCGFTFNGEIGFKYIRLISKAFSTASIRFTGCGTEILGWWGGSKWRLVVTATVIQ